MEQQPEQQSMSPPPTPPVDSVQSEKSQTKTNFFCHCDDRALPHPHRIDWIPSSPNFG
jgi:hypothetical protein